MLPPPPGRDVATANLPEAVDRLAQVNADLRSMLARPIVDIPPRAAAPNASATGLGSSDEPIRRRKRRRVDDSDSSDKNARIEYGYNGQVVPGKLKMQLVSADGGIAEDSAQQRSMLGSIGYMPYYGEQNILKDDDSVYCAKSPRCNIVLSHQGESTFSLERLVIKAPRAGFADP